MLKFLHNHVDYIQRALVKKTQRQVELSVSNRSGEMLGKETSFSWGHVTDELAAVFICVNPGT